jgi:molybdopterin synthase catalytic subunit
MKVTLRLFAGLRDLLGERQICLELPEGATISDLREQLGRRYPAVEPYLHTTACAIREEFVPRGHRLRDGDDVAIIPPVSGGADGDCFRVTGEPLDPEELLRAVRKDESGAMLLFLGVARNHSEGRRVLALEYEAYPEMAEKKLREVADDVRARWAVTGFGAFHRTGRLAIGETSLLVAVSSAHRQAAFEACHYAVDRIKQIVPVWKKEIWEDGEGEWVAGHPVEVPEQVDNKAGG